MKVLLVLASLVACALASRYSHQAGFQHVGNGVATPYRNADRQKAVNSVAHRVGAGTGTARYYGVPGAEGYYGYGGYDRGYGGYAGFGYGGPVYAAYGYGGYGPGFGPGYDGHRDNYPFAGPHGRFAGY